MHESDPHSRPAAAGPSTEGLTPDPATRGSREPVPPPADPELPTALGSAVSPPAGPEFPTSAPTVPAPDSATIAPPANSSGDTDPFQTNPGAAQVSDPVAWPAEHPEAPPQELPGYEILDVLGQGGMGVVYKARHLRMKRLVAVKVIRKDRGISSEAVQRFNKEIEAAAQLTHPNVVMAFDADEVEGTLYFVMEYIEGIDLSKLVKDKGPLPVAEACDYVRQAALGLQHAHERGMVHRDIKPSNLLLTRAEGLVKVLDMGLARLQESVADQPASQLTGSGVVVGTPDFMSPEQARDSRSVDIRTDLYALGCTLYFLLTGQVPFPDGTFTEKLLKHCMDEPRPLAQLRPDVPPGVVAIVDRLLAKRASARYQTPIELVEALTPFSGPGPRNRRSRSTMAIDKDAWTSGSPSGDYTDRLSAGGLMATSLGTPGLKDGAVDRHTIADASLTDRTAVPPAAPDARRRSFLLVAALLGLGLVAGAYYFGTVGPAAKVTSPLTEGPSGSQAAVKLASSRKVEPTAPVEVVPPKVVPPKVDPLPKIEPPKIEPPPKPQAGVMVRFPRPDQPKTLHTALASNGEWAVAGYDGGVHVWQVPLSRPTERPTATLKTLFPPSSVAILRDGQRVAMTRQADDPTTPAGKVPLVLWFVSAWDPKSAPQDRLIRGPKDALNVVALSTRGNLALTGGDDGAVRLWDLDNRRQKLQLGQHDTRVSAIALSADGGFALSGDRYGKVQLWDLEGSKKPVLFNRHKGTITSLAFSPDSRYAVSAGYDKLICVYDVAKGTLLHTCQGHTDPVQSVAFLPDNTHFLSGSEDTTVRLWDVKTTEHLRSYNDHNVGVLSVAASADGKYAVFICADNTVRRMELPDKLP